MASESAMRAAKDWLGNSPEECALLSLCIDAAFAAERARLQEAERLLRASIMPRGPYMDYHVTENVQAIIQFLEAKP